MAFTLSVEEVKGYILTATPQMRTVICIYDSNIPASAAFIMDFENLLCAPFGPYHDKIQFFSIDLASDHVGMDGFYFTRPETATIPAIWVVQGNWNLNDSMTTLENVAVGGAPHTGQCFDALRNDITTYLWS